MTIQTTITKDNYDESKVELAVDDSVLENGWLRISVGEEHYDILAIELEKFCRAILSRKETL